MSDPVVSRNVAVLAAGGLGNQLFQICAALTVKSENDLEILDFQGHQSMDEIAGELKTLGNYLSIGTDRKFARRNFKPGFFKSKLLNLALRVSTWTFENSRVQGIKLALKRCLEKFLSTRFLMNSRVFIAQGIGYSEIPVRAEMLIGYFQSEKYFEGVKTLYPVFDLVISNPRNNELKLRNKELKILVVQIRLADYRDNQSIGLLKRDYFSEAITTAWCSGSYNTIWLFSDEIFLAKQYIPKELESFLSTPEVEFSDPLEILEAMRLGHGYVISNSTFGWWGARLSYESEPQVIYPSPWFSRLPQPKFNVPSTWTPLQAQFSSQKGDNDANEFKAQ